MEIEVIYYAWCIPLLHGLSYRLDVQLSSASIKLLYGEVTYTYSNEVHWRNDHIRHLEVQLWLISIRSLYSEVTYTYNNGARWHNDHVRHLNLLVRANSIDARNLHL